jgi:mono/diheme cytochrome c family protein
MANAIRSWVVLAAVVSLSGTVCFAQSSGETTYKSKCQTCHGANGMPNPGIARMMGVKAVSDPEIMGLTASQMFSSAKNGKGKMAPFKGKLADAQIKDSVDYYRGLMAAGHTQDQPAEADAPAPQPAPTPDSSQAPEPPSTPDSEAAPVKFGDIPPPPPPADAPPPTVAIGQTEDQVIASFGPPMRVAKLGVKEILYYKDMKVTFIKGKVSDVE